MLRLSLTHEAGCTLRAGKVRAHLSFFGRAPGRAARLCATLPGAAVMAEIPARDLMGFSVGPHVVVVHVMRVQAEQVCIRIEAPDEVQIVRDGAVRRVPKAPETLPATA